ncbi:epoxide hydrolase [Flavobacterium sp. ANB]|uniref:epoxide hydrolase family protein n=1 Tax=unclassified Flavobacterium TaxID=196869 RepID=UPI0012B8E980|nr:MULTISPECIES: epoxide hydrolase family protein [unclassified Flavobacterium]MBF4517847.1 epoxide hydrolase [Flavobacterium sp. ANB]MTD72083.1 epoxide hydrolase [Flavobacterium sp. LC2016-13]
MKTIKQHNGKFSGIIIAIALIFMITAGFAQKKQAANNTSESIRPFQYHATQAQLDDLKHRIQNTKWPEKELVIDNTQGVPQTTIQALAKYWENDYDWRKIETKINSYPNFITTIDGVDIHFIQVKSKHKNALPIIITHGWPGSIIEQLKIIGPLTDPTAYGGKAEDAFDVIIPSIPGYGFSGKPTELGWGPERIGKTWVTLMKRLGYTKFVAQGGDWGALITDMMGVQAAPELIAIHTNMAGAVPPAIDAAAFTGAPEPANLSTDEKKAYGQLSFFYKHGLAYAQEMGNRPQTLYAIEDSPIGLASWILDHDARSLELISRTFAGKKEGLTKDDILDNITLYWLTNTAVSSSRLYWENKLAFFAPKNVKIPVAVSVYPDEIYSTPRSWAEKAYPNLLYFNTLQKGGHFAAWEQPETFTKELRASFKSVRK